MKLLTTGAFVRASRAARLSLPARTSPFLHVPHRWIGTQPTPEQPAHNTFPEQSVSASQEVDPTKTASETIRDNETDHEVEAKQYILGANQGNKIVHVNARLSGTQVLGKPYVFDATSNTTQSILDLVGRNLYDNPDHPLCITRRLIESCFPSPTFNHTTVADPVVTVANNFDVLGFPADHPGRSRTDTYYVNSSHVLRTHTSAHQHDAFKSLATNPNGASGYTICADVYRRDSIDKSHFPIFHQMEGAKIWPLPPQNPHLTRLERQNLRAQGIAQETVNLPNRSFVVTDQAKDFHVDRNPVQLEHIESEVKLVVRHLKKSLEHLVQTIFSAAQASGAHASQASKPAIRARWIEAYFPFTTPSFEFEVFYNGSWLELLGCGVVQQPILDNAGLRHHVAWAWGLGIERFAMLLFNIPDIRLFWSQDPRFLQQFTRGKITQFEPFSKYPACYKDVAFWINPSPSASSPVLPDQTSSTGAAVAAGGDAKKSSPAQTQPAAFHENDIMEIVRDVAGDLVEDVTLVDEFVKASTGRKSLCYRINYRSLERTLTNEEVNRMHEEVRGRLQAKHGLELR